MWMGFLLLSDWRKRSCAITRLARLSSIWGEWEKKGGVKGGVGGNVWGSSPPVRTGPMTQTMRSRSRRE